MGPSVFESILLLSYWLASCSLGLHFCICIPNGLHRNYWKYLLNILRRFLFLISCYFFTHHSQKCKQKSLDNFEKISFKKYKKLTVYSRVFPRFPKKMTCLTFLLMLYIRTDTSILSYGKIQNCTNIKSLCLTFFF